MRPASACRSRSPTSRFRRQRSRRRSPTISGSASRPATIRRAFASRSPGTCTSSRTSQAALDAFYPYYRNYFLHHAPHTTQSHEIPRDLYDKRAAADGPLFVGSPQQIVDKMLWERELFGHQRYLAQVDIGGLPFAEVARTIELLGAKVAPAVREA